MMRVRVKSIRRTARHPAIATRRPTYDGQDFARVSPATWIVEGHSGAAGSEALVLASDGSSETLGPASGDTGSSVARETEADLAEALASHVARERTSSEACTMVMYGHRPSRDTAHAPHDLEDDGQPR